MNKIKKASAPIGASLIVLSSIFYGSYGVWTKLMGDSFGSFSQVGIRSMLIVAILLPLALLQGQWKRIHWRRDLHWFLLLLVACALIGAPLYYATLIVGVGLSSTLFYAGFVLAMFLFGKLFNGEHFTKDKLVSTLLAVIGLLLIFGPSSQHFGWLAIGAALLSGLAAALDLVVSQKLPYTPSQTTVLTWSASIVTCIPIALLAHEHISTSAAPWLYLVLFSLAALAASFFSISGVKLISAGAAGILGLMEIVAGVLFGAILFHERPSLQVLTGIFIIILAAAIPYIQEYRFANKLAS